MLNSFNFRTLLSCKIFNQLSNIKYHFINILSSTRREKLHSKICSFFLFTNVKVIWLFLSKMSDVNAAELKSLYEEFKQKQLVCFTLLANLNFNKILAYCKSKQHV